MKNIEACLTHKSDDWQTPKELYDPLMKMGYRDTFKYQSEENELENNYYNEKLFINPPFSKMKQVTEWIKQQYINNNEIILLIPARTDTKYFHELLLLQPNIYMFKGRMHYNESKSAPFPTIALIFNNKWLFKVQKYNYGDIKKFIKSL